MEETTSIPPQDTQANAGSGPDGTHGDAITAFCQQCGRALTTRTKRQVGTAIFCEPCASARAAGWTPVNTAGSAGSAGTPSSKRAGGPNPVRAAFLGLVPGVGAMYNDQYPKGVLHLVIFVVLLSVADNLNWVFWWFVWGWIFYQSFDAYHTAQARRDGLPLPDPFGLNEWAQRFGGGRHAAPGRHAASGRHGASGAPADSQTAAAPVPEVPSSMPPQYEQTSAPYPVASAYQDPVASTSERTDYWRTRVPVSDYVAPGPFSSPVPEDLTTPRQAGAETQAPYTSTYTGMSGNLSPTAAPTTGRSFPTGAAWLIGLGVLFLLGNLMPSWHLDGRWFVPVLLTGIAFWTGARRLAALPELRGGGLWQDPAPHRVASALFGPILLQTLAVLLAFQAAKLVVFRHSWPALLVVWGGLQAIERTRPAYQATTVGTGAGPAAPPNVFP